MLIPPSALLSGESSVQCHCCYGQTPIPFLWNWIHPRSIETVNVKDPPDVLDRQKCLDALAALRHAKWFQVWHFPLYFAALCKIWIFEQVLFSFVYSVPSACFFIIQFVNILSLFIILFCWLFNFWGNMSGKCVKTNQKLVWTKTFCDKFWERVEMFSAYIIVVKVRLAASACSGID